MQLLELGTNTVLIDLTDSDRNCMTSRHGFLMRRSQTLST